MRGQGAAIQEYSVKLFAVCGSRRGFTLCLLFFCAFFAPSLPAQTTSTITGTVRDKQGLAVAGAEVHVTSSELAIDRSTTTEADGTYHLTALPPGIYAIK